MLVQIDDPGAFEAVREALTQRGLALRYAGAGHYVAGDETSARRITPLLGAVAVTDDALRHTLGLRRDREPDYSTDMEQAAAEYADVTTGRSFTLILRHGRLGEGGPGRGAA